MEKFSEPPHKNTDRNDLSSLPSLNKLMLNDSFSSESDDDFLDFAERIRSTPRQLVRFKENKISESGDVFLSKKCMKDDFQFKLPQSQTLSSSIKKTSDYQFVTPINRLKYGGKICYSESVVQKSRLAVENQELTPLKYSKIIKPKSQIKYNQLSPSSESENESNIFKAKKSEKKLLKNTSLKVTSKDSKKNEKKNVSLGDSEEENEFLNFAERIRNTPRFKARNLVHSDTEFPEKKNLFPTPNPLKEKNSEKSSDFFISNSWTPVQKANAKEYSCLFLSYIEDSNFFFKSREKISKRLYAFYNEKLFNSELPIDMVINWKNSLIRTAGLTHYRKNNNVRSCFIELSSKLLTSFDRLQDTLLHEMCHAAVFIISKSTDGHGPLWKTWSFRCSLIFPFIKCPERCHSYEQNYKLWYSCPKCNWKIGRHRQSKSLNCAQCRNCKSRLIVKTEF